MTNGITIYKRQIRSHIPTFIPFYQLGMQDLTQPHQPAALGKQALGNSFLAIWRRDGPEEVLVPWSPLETWLLYPTNPGIQISRVEGALKLRFPQPYMGCIVAAAASSGR